jgi:hypothetical protein
MDRVLAKARETAMAMVMATERDQNTNPQPAKKTLEDAYLSLIMDRS